jgi:hypothetical protein
MELTELTVDGVRRIVGKEGDGPRKGLLGFAVSRKRRKQATLQHEGVGVVRVIAQDLANGKQSRGGSSIVFESADTIA